MRGAGRTAKIPHRRFKGGSKPMETAEILFLGLVLTAFVTFSGTVMWVLNDDLRHRAERRRADGPANDDAAGKASLAA